MTSYDHLIEGSSEFIGESSLGYVTALISLEAINIVIVEMEGFQFLRQPKSLHEFMNESTQGESNPCHVWWRMVYCK